MAKRALLVGCNYPGSDAALRGCVNDVYGMRDLLTGTYGFEEADITIMIDTDESYTSPTGKNIKGKLKELVKVSGSGDILFFHFSGHGTQIPSDDEEIDGKDEAICPTDMNVITDDDLRVIMDPLDDGCKFTMVADCCHSGSLLDHQAVTISGNKDGSAGPTEGGGGPGLEDLMGMFGMKGVPEGGHKVGEDESFKNRAIPTNMFMSFLTSKLGGQAVGKGNVASSLQSLFGSDGSAKMNAYASLAAAGIGAATGHKVSSGQMGMITKILGMLCGGGGSSGGDGSTMQTGGGGEPQLNVSHVPGQKPSQLLGDDKGILITGCQAHETSADACPSGDPNKAYGALSNAIQSTLKKSGPETTYRELVTNVRSVLMKTGFAQNPCLECSDKNADKRFILH